MFEKFEKQLQKYKESYSHYHTNTQRRRLGRKIKKFIKKQNRCFQKFNETLSKIRDVQIKNNFYSIMAHQNWELEDYYWCSLCRTKHIVKEIFEYNPDSHNKIGMYMDGICVGYGNC